jgi:hypothetical protein
MHGGISMYHIRVFTDVHYSSMQVPGLKHHLKKQTKAVEEDGDSDDNNNNAVNKILAQWNSEVDEHIVCDIFLIDTGLMDVQDSG